MGRLAWAAKYVLFRVTLALYSLRWRIACRLHPPQDRCLRCATIGSEAD